MTFERLADLVEQDLAALDPAQIPLDWRESVVTGRLQFGFADGGNTSPVLEGRIEARIAAVCQRCLKAFDLPLQTKLRLQLSVAGKTPVAVQGYELWELDETEMSPLELLDEALVMAMPLSARHEDLAMCVAVEVTDKREEMTTPFASLRAQMDETN